MKRFQPISQKLLQGVIAAALTVGLSFSMMACAPTKTNEQPDDILSQKPLDSNKENITILVKYAFTINNFETAVEEKFPNVNIVQVGNFTGSMGIDEYATRLEHQDTTDIVMAWPYEAGEQYWEESLLDLSGMPFSSRYNISSLSDIARDGKIYYLPGPAQVRGIIYNKTMFQENGWEVPADFTGFVDLCKTIDASGIRSLQLGLKNSEVLDTAFTGYSFAECYSKPQDTRWMNEYAEGSGASFGDHFGTALDTFQDLINNGVLRASDLSVDYAKRESMLFSRECAMVEDSVLLTHMGEAATGTTDEFALMPFFNPNGGGDWARIYPVCYVGLGKHLAEAENSEKYETVLEIMDFISTTEGQESLMSDTGAMYSSLNGLGAPNVAEIEDIKQALNQGRYGIFPTLKNAQDALRTGLAGMIQGNISKTQVIEMVDTQNASPSQNDASGQALGSATDDFSLIETGNLVTDAMRAEAGTDFALFLDNGKDGRYNGKGISAKLYQGDITLSDIARIMPDFKRNETGTLWKAHMTGESLIKTLEYSITIDNNQSGWFYYFSGLKMTYDPQKAPGSRISAIEKEDGSPIEPETIYTIAVMDETVPEENWIDVEKSHRAIEDIIIQAIQKQKNISPSNDNRFTVG